MPLRRGGEPASYNYKKPGESSDPGPCWLSAHLNTYENLRLTVPSANHPHEPDTYFHVLSLKLCVPPTSLGSITATFPFPSRRQNLAAVAHPPVPPPTTTNL